MRQRLSDLRSFRQHVGVGNIQDQTNLPSDVNAKTVFTGRELRTANHAAFTSDQQALIFLLDRG